MSYRVYGIEIKAENGTFEIYNPNMIDILLYLWNDNYKEESDFKPRIVKADRTKPLRLLRDLIYEMFDFKQTDSLFIFKKMDLNQNNYTTSELNFLNEELERSLLINCIHENTKIYIEFKDNNFTKSKSNFLKVII